MEEGGADIDQAILTALLKSKILFYLILRVYEIELL